MPKVAELEVTTEAGETGENACGSMVSKQLRLVERCFCYTLPWQEGTLAAAEAGSWVIRALDPRPQSQVPTSS